MKKIVSEDAIRRAFKAIDETEGAAWLRGHLTFCVEPLLAERWILDVDTTVKPLYGHQEGAVWATIARSAVSSHAITPIRWPRRVLFSTSTSALATSIRASTARGACGRSLTVCRATCDGALRGDCGFGNEAVMRAAEARGLPIFSSGA